MAVAQAPHVLAPPKHVALTPSRSGGYILVAIAVAVFAAGPPVLVHERDWRPIQVWALALIAFVAMLWSIGRATGARLIVDERDRWSLSRVQLLTWTSLILPSMWTMVICRIFGDAGDPLALGMDEHLWMLLGISATSFVGSPLILERKRASSPGLLDSPRDAGRDNGGARDLVRGEDAGNADVIDIGRIQMLFFTGVSVCTYFAACWHAFASEASSALAFPAVSSDLVALLGISHATYLVNKNTDRPVTPSAPDRALGA